MNIAIVGMGCLFPNATTPDTFWTDILHRHTAAAEVPVHRWVTSQQHLISSTPQPDRTFSGRSCLIKPFPISLDRFALAPDALKHLDPMVHIALHAARDSWMSCNHQSIDPSRVDVILAAIALPTDSASRLTRSLLGYRNAVSAADGHRNISHEIAPDEAKAARVTAIPAAVISRALGFGGNSWTLDAACASSLYALKLGCDALSSGRVDAVLVGGVSRPDNLYARIGFSQLRALSPSGVCRPFDRRADGLVVGEGAGILVLKRLEDALRDGDTIHAVVRGIGLSNDMRGNLLAPDTEGQLRAMRAAYAAAGWDPMDVDLVECHGAGTPVGDAVEIQSLRTLWKDASPHSPACIIGSVKSNIGHLLTAAGAASVIKVLMAMREKAFPPTPTIPNAEPDSLVSGSPFQILPHSRPWPSRGADIPRRAAVSAFGFGGINAHVLLEEYHPPLSKDPEISVEPYSVPIAVIGMDAAFGTIHTLRAFQETIFQGRSIISNRPHTRWGRINSTNTGFPELHSLPGGFLDAWMLDPSHFRIPPAELRDIVLQHLLMMHVSRAALLNAGMEIRASRPHCGTVIGMGFDPEATDFQMRWLPESPAPDFSPPLNASRTLGALGGIIASRIAREFGFGGPSFTVSGEETSGLRAVETAVRLLQRGETDIMLAGAVDMAGDIRNILTRHAASPYSRRHNLIPFSPESDGTLPGEGAAAVILKRLDQAIADGNRIYAVINGIGGAIAPAGGNEKTLSDTCLRSIRRCLAESGARLETIGLLEAHGSSDPQEDRIEARAFHTLFGNVPGFRAVSSVKSTIGHAGAAAGMASFVKACLCLYHEILPALPHSPEKVIPEFETGGFHIPLTAQYWVRNRKEGPRRALVCAMTPDRCFSHILLQEVQDPENNQIKPAFHLERTRPTGYEAPGLFVAAGPSDSALLENLKELREFIHRTGKNLPMECTARRWHVRQSAQRQRAHAVSLVAESEDLLLRALSEATNAVRNRISGQIAGLCRFAYQPQLPAETGQTALVYPGSGNHSLALCRKVGTVWPQILSDMDHQTPTLAMQMIPEHLMPWRSAWPLEWEREATARLAANPVHAIFAQVMSGCILTRVVSRFGISPDAVIGYSLGETAGLFATGAWSEPEAMLERMQRTRLFSHDLSGPCKALRKSWGIGPDDPFEWAVAAVHHPPEEIRNIVKSRKDIRLLIVNTPEECVIGGNRQSLWALINDVKCEAVFLDGVVTVHCDAVIPIQEEYRKLHLFPTSPLAGLRYYSCRNASAYVVTPESAAESITGQAVHGFDFPRLIHQAYSDGIRIFLEMGPHATCTRMIDSILGDRPHIALSASFRGEDEILSILKFLGNLIACRVPVSLDALYGDQSWPPSLPLFPDPPPARSILRTAGVWADHAPAFVPTSNPAEIRADVSPILSEPVDSALPEHTVRAVPPQTPEPGEHPGADVSSPLLSSLREIGNTVFEAHRHFLEMSAQSTRSIADAVDIQVRLLTGRPPEPREPDTRPTPGPASPKPFPAFTREQCMEFAVGSASAVLGDDFAEVDTYPVRVRLPDEPLMLVDRILSVEGNRGVPGKGRIVTEHDVRPDAWYLDGGRAPVCISVEAGQADLFLSAWMGIDKIVRGTRAYRLLDAQVTFHRGLPVPGETIRYDIHIDRFVRQGDTWMFFFRFRGEIDGSPLITMTNGCAGFFTKSEIHHSGGIIWNDSPETSPSEKKPALRYSRFPLAVESYDDSRLEALRAGNPAGCFGEPFSGITIPENLRLPGGRMKLIDRISLLDPEGGIHGMGLIRAEADIRPEDWFLTCHFMDDPVMPGTLMYECCSHALRVFLQRMGWFTSDPEACYEPVPGQASILKCRGPVTPETRLVVYEIHVAEIGFNPEPTVIADARMIADGKRIVHFTGMSMKLSGHRREDILPELMDRTALESFSRGEDPSTSFGDTYRSFDPTRFLARLPSPPYLFLDRVVRADPPPAILRPDGWITAEYDIHPDAWFFLADRSGIMPFCVLQETALQASGWLAAWCGSALLSPKDLHFRNLGGSARVFRDVTPISGVLELRTRLTRVSVAGDMILTGFETTVTQNREIVYGGTTDFGFFTNEALIDQRGIRNGTPEAYVFQRTGSRPFLRLPAYPPFEPQDANPVILPCPGYPAAALRMIDIVDDYDPTGGVHGRGVIRGHKDVNPNDWYFHAHFHQDPVCPGSLGLESFLQLLKTLLIELNTSAGPRWNRFTLVTGRDHSWTYRGQIVPANRRIDVEAHISFFRKDPAPLILADGFLEVDGLRIYEMKDFGIGME
jgi:PfaB family protein